jgi:hypothetical protein
MAAFATCRAAWRRGPQARGATKGTSLFFGDLIQQLLDDDHVRGLVRGCHAGHGGPHSATGGHINSGVVGHGSSPFPYRAGALPTGSRAGPQDLLTAARPQGDSKSTKKKKKIGTVAG